MEHRELAGEAEDQVERDRQHAVHASVNIKIVSTTSPRTKRAAAVGRPPEAKNVACRFIFAAEQPGRPEQQDRHQDDEPVDVAEGARQEDGADALDDAEDDAAASEPMTLPMPPRIAASIALQNVTAAHRGLERVQARVERAAEARERGRINHHAGLEARRVRTPISVAASGFWA